ncbi:hypothetical protein BHE74_00019852 [Ensete ventricosum]|nr:hypothetical protein GW17_00024731 [Ensete ventricosum]RWW72346.1 hypothetical protein BHE74_00019852 [Ensete ventricosum]
MRLICASASMLFTAAPTRSFPPSLPHYRCSRDAVLAFAAKLHERRAVRSHVGGGASKGRAALRSGHVPEGRDPPPTPNIAEEGTDGGTPGPLRGSDVLQALQKAVAKREARKLGDKKKRRKKAATDGRGEALGFDHGQQVRPVEIRSDWRQRIDELERRVQELRSQYH